MSSRKRTFVTGGTGFIGSQLVERLVGDAHDVTCLVLPGEDTRRLSALGVKTTDVCLLDADALGAAVDGCDAVFHLAGVVRALKKSEFQRVNVQGTECVAEACAAQSTPPVLLFVSSLAAVGPTSPDRPLTEADPARPVSNYGRSKRDAELALARFADRVPITIVRPGMVFGRHDMATLSIFKTIKRFGLHIVPGRRPAPLMSMIFAADLVELMLRAMGGGARLSGDSEATPGRGVYFASDSAAIDYSELGHVIARSVGRERIRVAYAQKRIWMVALLSELWGHVVRRQSPFNFDKYREATAGSWIGSPEAARRDLGFQPARSLTDRIDETTAWYRDQELL